MLILLLRVGYEMWFEVLALEEFRPDDAFSSMGSPPVKGDT